MLLILKSPIWPRHSIFSIFFFKGTPTTKLYTLSLHDALPISAADLQRAGVSLDGDPPQSRRPVELSLFAVATSEKGRSEEHTSELQSHSDLVCRLLLEKKNRDKEPNAY